MSRRCAQELNVALHEIFEERDDVYLLGEDLLDPYGGAFKISQGLSTRWPDRVLATPISEASIFGVAAGMALRGYRPIVEIMFGDFITLGFDQIVNGIAKFREMFDEGVTVPLVVRTPMGGGRGYGPTHSQSLEKLLLGVPGIAVVAPSECHDLRALLAEAVADDEPVFFVENKLMYGRPNRRPEGGYVDEFRCVESDGRYPALTFSGNSFAGADATIVTYGGMLPIALEAARELILEHEVFTEVVALGQLLPLDLEPVLESVGRTGSLVTLEEGTLTAGVGSEIAARVQAEAWDDLRGPVRRVAARDGIVPAARGSRTRCSRASTTSSPRSPSWPASGARRPFPCWRSSSRVKTPTVSRRSSPNGWWTIARRCGKGTRSASSRRRRRRSRSRRRATARSSSSCPPASRSSSGRASRSSRRATASSPSRRRGNRRRLPRSRDSPRSAT